VPCGSRSIGDGANWRVNLERRALINSVTTNIVTRDRLRVDTLKWAAAKLAPKRYGKGVEETAGKPDANAVETYLLRLHEQRRLSQLVADEERERDSNRIFRIIEDVDAKNVTPQERRRYLARELAVYARDGGLRELATQLDELGALEEPHPIDNNAETFTFNIDKAGGDEPDIATPVIPRTTIVITRVPRGIDGRPADDETSEPNDEPERLPFVPTPAPSHAVAQNGDLRARARVRGLQ
jgi:hypothetical protein